MKHGLVTLVVVMILRDAATFQVAFTYLKVKPAKRLCLHPVVLVLVLRIGSCLHLCNKHTQRKVILTTSEPKLKTHPLNDIQQGAYHLRQRSLIPQNVTVKQTP